MEDVYPENVLQNLSLSYSLWTLVPQLAIEDVLMLADYIQPAQMSKTQEEADIHSYLYSPHHWPPS